jgi:antitoxin HicB
MKGRAEEQKGIEYYTQLPYSILLHQVEDEGKKYWIAEVPELPGCKSHGSTVEEAVKSVEEAKKDWITDSLEEGESVPVPIEIDRYSGKILVRMSRSLHRALSLIAESEKLSLNQLIVTILAKEVGRFSVLNRAEEKIDRLLDRINDVLEEEELRTSLKSLRVTVGHPEQGQYLWVGTAHTLEAPVAAANVGMFTSGVVSTASPLEECWSYPCLQRPRRERIIFSTSEVKGSESQEAAESKQK